MDYTENREQDTCDLTCERWCQCQLCDCCSVCSDLCQCSSNISDLDEKMERTFGFGDNNYRFLSRWRRSKIYLKFFRMVQEFYKSLDFSDLSEESEESLENSDLDCTASSY